MDKIYDICRGIDVHKKLKKLVEEEDLDEINIAWYTRETGQLWKENSGKSEVRCCKKKLRQNVAKM